jgi:hypothetical protein
MPRVKYIGGTKLHYKRAAPGVVWVCVCQNYTQWWNYPAGAGSERENRQFKCSGTRTRRDFFLLLHLMQTFFIFTAAHEWVLLFIGHLLFLISVDDCRCALRALHQPFLTSLQMIFLWSVNHFFSNPFTSVPFGSQHLFLYSILHDSMLFQRQPDFLLIKWNCFSQLNTGTKRKYFTNSQN